MLKNYFKIAVRNLLKYKFYSIINILGLSMGIAAFLFIFMYLQDELSYDTYHEHQDKIVRVDVTVTHDDIADLNLVLSSYKANY